LKLSIKEMSYAAMLAALSIIFYFVPALPTPWGMNLDIIALPWFIGLFMFGSAVGFLSMVIGCIVLSLIAAAGWIGILAKFLASLCLMLPFFFYKNKIVSGIIGIVLRSTIMIFANYYFFLPLWFNMQPAALMEKFPFWIILLPNVIQSLIDLGIAEIVYVKLRGMYKG